MTTKRCWACEERIDSDGDCECTWRYKEAELMQTQERAESRWDDPTLDPGRGTPTQRQVDEDNEQRNDIARHGWE